MKTVFALFALLALALPATACPPVQFRPQLGAALSYGAAQCNAPQLGAPLAADPCPAQLGAAAGYYGMGVPLGAPLGAGYYGGGFAGAPVGYGGYGAGRFGIGFSRFGIGLHRGFAGVGVRRAVVRPAARLNIRIRARR